MVAFLVDDFNDNSIDSSKWDVNGAPTESSSRINISQPGSGSATSIDGKRYYNIREGILAAKLVAKSGATHASVLIGVGVRDQSGNFWRIDGQSSSATFSRANSGPNAGTTTVVDTTVGFGPTLAANSWLGFTYNNSDNTIRLVKSTDNGANWTQLHRCIITGGTMTWGNCGLILRVANTSGGTSNLVASYDDVNYFATDTFLKSKVRVGGAWVAALPKVRVDGAWVPARSKNRVGGTWVDPN